MSRHPFHVQDCESIWHLAEYDEDADSRLDPLSFSFDSPNAFVSKFPRAGNIPEGWTSATTRADKERLQLDSGHTPVLESDANASGINITVQKYGGSYTLWIDGRVSNKDSSGIHKLPAYNAYYRQIDVDGTKERGVLTPINFSVLLEDGERPPDRVVLKTYQVRRKSGALMHREMIGETDLKTTSANGIVGDSVVMPYPCAYTQKPYVTIRDVGASRIARLRETGGQAYHMVTLGLSFVLKYAIGVVTGDGSVSAFNLALRNLGKPTGGTSRATWIQWVSALLSYGIPSLTLLGFTVSTFTDWWVGFGMIASVQSLSVFLTNAFKITGLAGEDGTLPGLLSLFPVGGASALKMKGLTKILPLAVLWMAKNVLTARPMPEVRRVRYTPMDLVESIRAISSSDASRVSAFDYKEKVLLEWMLEPSVADEGRMRKAMRAAQDYLGKALLKSSNVFPRSGGCLLDGYELSKLAEDTIDIEYELVVMDQSLCDPRPTIMTIRGDSGSMLNGGLLSSGIIEDNEILKAVVEEAIDIMSRPDNTWRVFHAVIGLPIRALPPNVLNAMRDNANAEAIVSFREKILKGLNRINIEIREAALQPFVEEARSRDRMAVLNHLRFETNNLIRLLPQRLIPDARHVATPQKSDISNIRYDTVAADDVPGQHTTAESSTPAMAEKENKFVSDAAKRAHKAASECLKEFVDLWRMGTGRPIIWQLFRIELEDDQEFTPAVVRRLSNAIRGEPLAYRMVRVDTSYIPFAFNYPSDIALMSSEYDTTIGPTERTVFAMVDRKDKPNSNSESCAWNTAMMALSEVVCDAHVSRAYQTGSMGVMVGIESIVSANVRDGVMLFDAMFPGSNPKDCWFLRESDPIFYSLPGGRLLKSIMMHLISMEGVLYAFDQYTGRMDSTRPIPLSYGCRELASSERYMHSAPGVVLVHGAPISLFALLKRTINQLKALSTSLFKTTLASPVSSAVADISYEPNVEKVVLRLQGSVKTVFVFGTAAFNDDANSIHVLLSKTASDPLLVRIGWDEVQRFDMIAESRAPNTNRNRRVEPADTDRGELLKFLKTRNASHCIGIESFYNGSRDILPFADGMSYDELLAQITDYETPRSRLLYPFACGSWTPPMKLLDAQPLNFDTVPIFCDLLSTSFKSVMGDTDIEGTLGTIADRFAGYDYEEWNVSDKLQSPFVVEVDRQSMVAWISMSNPITLQSELEDVDFGDAKPSSNLYDAFATSRSTRIHSSLKREGANSMLWNAERIVQSVYSLMGFSDDEERRTIFVRKPRAWRPSEKEREIRAVDERKIREALRVHMTMEPFVVSSYMRNVWDAILNVYRGNVQEVDMLDDDDAPPVDGGAGVLPTGVLPLGPEVLQFTPTPGQGPQPLLMNPSIPQVPGSEVFENLYALSSSLFFSGGDDVGSPPVPSAPPVPEESAKPIEPVDKGFDTDGSGDEADKEAGGDAAGGGKAGASEPGGTSDDPDVDPELDPKMHGSTGSIPSFDTLVSIITKLKLSLKFASYIKNVHERNLRAVKRWTDNKRKLEEELEATIQSNDEWEARAAEVTDALDTKLLLHSCCSIAVAQAMIHHVIGDVVTLRMHPEDRRGSPPVVDITNEGLARIASGMDACVGESIHWMTLGECVHMLEVVCSR